MHRLMELSASAVSPCSAPPRSTFSWALSA